MNTPGFDRERYDRQLDLIDDSGQEKLGRSAVALVGLGGLGSPAAVYLALAGLGELVLIDHDHVILSNLNRQFLHWDGDLSRAKTDSAREKIEKLNPETRVKTVDCELTPDTLEDLPEVDVIIGAVDNFRARYLSNRFAVEKGIPYIHGAVEGFQGQTTTIIPGDTPCLDCVFPESPPERSGLQVFGVTAGIIGTLMATETIKYLVDQGDLFRGEMLMLDLLRNEFETLPLEKNPNCPICGNL